MKKQKLAIVSIFLFVLLIILNNYVIAQSNKGHDLTKEQLEAFRSAKTVRIEVNQSYWKMEKFSLPFDTVAKRLLESVGIKVASQIEETYDLLLIIEVKGVPLGADYLGTRDGGHYYLGASFNGFISLNINGIPPYKKTFEDEVKPPGSVGPQVFKNDPYTARSAFEIIFRNSPFGTKIAEMLAEIYGMDFLAIAIKDELVTVRKYALQTFVKKQDSHIIEILLEAFKDKDINRNCRCDIISTLGKIGDSRAIEPLISVLKDKDSYVRVDAAQALGDIGDSRVVEPLIAALKDEEGEFEWGVIEALGDIGDSRAVEPLATALKDDFHVVREVAAQALGRIGDYQAVESLIALLKDEEKDVRKSAIEALIKISEAGDPRAVEPLIIALNDRDFFVRTEAARALGRIGDPRAVEPLIIALNDKELVVRINAAIALGKISDPHAVEPLVSLRKDSSVRKFATQALIKISEALIEMGDSQAIESFVAILKDDESEVRDYLIKLLIDAVSDQESSIRHSAVWALGEIGDPRAVEPLIIALLDDDLNVRNNAAGALRKITGKNFGEKQKKWQKWWEKNKKRFLKKE